MKKDRSCSGGNLEFPGSPCVNRRSHKEKQPSYSRLRLNPNTVTPAQIVELTIFHIPGLDVKVRTYLVMLGYIFHNILSFELNL